MILGEFGMIFCSNCGKANEETANFCPNCGTALHHRDPLDREDYIAGPETNHYKGRSSSVYDDSKPGIGGGLKAIFIILSVLFPFAGIVIGIIYLNDPMEEKRVFGKRLLIFSILWTLLIFIVPFIAFVLFSTSFGHHYMYY